MDRRANLEQLDQVAEWDVVIIGGGASGLGIALDSANRGYKTLLLEKNDFAKVVKTLAVSVPITYEKPVVAAADSPAATIAGGIAYAASGISAIKTADVSDVVVFNSVILFILQPKSNQLV